MGLSFLLFNAQRPRLWSKNLDYAFKLWCFALKASGQLKWACSLVFFVLLLCVISACQWSWSLFSSLKICFWNCHQTGFFFFFLFPVGEVSFPGLGNPTCPQWNNPTDIFERSCTRFILDFSVLSSEPWNVCFSWFNLLSNLQRKSSLNWKRVSHGLARAWNLFSWIEIKLRRFGEWFPWDIWDVSGSLLWINWLIYVWNFLKTWQITFVDAKEHSFSHWFFFFYHNLKCTAWKPSSLQETLQERTVHGTGANSNLEWEHNLVENLKDSCFQTVMIVLSL